MTLLRDDVVAWRAEVVEFLDQHRRPIPALDNLSPLQHWHRRVTGGVLRQFFQFLARDMPEDHFPILQENPFPERLFLFLTDLPGFHAAQGLIDTESDQALILLREEWMAFLEDFKTWDDEDYKLHYEFWAVWHRQVPKEWEGRDPSGPGELWVHEEGFALADGAGRGAQHLWRWDGETLHLEAEALTSWASMDEAKS